MDKKEFLNFVAQGYQRIPVSKTLESFNINRLIDVVPNFIDSSLYFPETDLLLRKKYAKENEFIITHVSNFRKVKRVQDVVYIFEKIRKKTPAKLLMIGDGPERLQSEQLCRSLGLSKDVKYLGKLKIIEKIYNFGSSSKSLTLKTVKGFLSDSKKSKFKIHL